MPRNLPWKVAPSTPSLRAALPPLSKRRPPTPALASPRDDARLSNGDASHSKRPPPPEEEYMQPGLKADDAYMMVEDEFLATARTFTAHLHHAEYKRIKAAARERKRLSSRAPPHQSAPYPDVSAISGPSKRAKASAANQTRNRAALESIGAVRAANSATDSGPSDTDNAELDPNNDGPDFTAKRSPPRADDPWLGTSLAPLLTPRKRRAEAHIASPPVLAGLPRIGALRSDTRASRGYGKPLADVGKRGSREADVPFLPLSSPPRKLRGRPPVRGSETSSGDDDLDILPIARPKGLRAEVARLPSPPPRKERAPLLKDWEDEATGEDAALATKPNKAARPVLEKQRIKPWMKERTQDDASGQRKKLDLNEIPTFLV